jgi:hypothetical protein
MSHSVVENYNNQMTKLIKKILKNGKRYDADALYQLTSAFLHDATNKGEGICSCNNIIRHPNGGEVIQHVCGAGLMDIAKYFGKSVGTAATKRMANDSGEGISNKLVKLDNNVYQKDGITYLPQHLLRGAMGFGFGWGRSDLGDMDKVTDYLKAGMDTAEEVGKLL